MGESEFEFIQTIRTTTPPHARVLVGPGDDCAVLAPCTRRTLISTDVLTEGVDFLLSECGPRAVGRKAMGANLSDIAAMGGRPTAAVVGVVFPQGIGCGKELHAGLRDVADAFGVPIVGGDTNSWQGGLVVAVTVLGVPIREPVLRSGAKPGDWIFVTGPVGGSILGRHLSPKPRLSEVDRLLSVTDIHAMIDISDGMAADLNHILVESGCGAVLTGEGIPVHPDAVRLAQRSGKSPLDHALGDGEDFELLFTLPPDAGAALLAVPPVPVWKVGECVSARGLWFSVGGATAPLTPAGWEHRL